MSETPERTPDYLMPMFTIYDKAADRHEAPLIAPTRDVACRRFSDLVNAPDTLYNMHPEDFCLQEAGMWNVRTGRCQEGGSFERVATGLEVKHAKE